MLKTLCFAILLILSSWPATLVAQERYLVSYNGFGVGQAPIWATKDFGLFCKIWIEYRSCDDLRIGSWDSSFARRKHPLRSDRWDGADRGDQPGSGSRAHRRRHQQVSL